MSRKQMDDHISTVAMLGFGDPESQWGGTNAVTNDILNHFRNIGYAPLYIYGVGGKSGVVVRRHEYGYGVAARRFFLNTSACFYTGEDAVIISAIVDICRRNDVHVVHIQDYCGWPYGLIARLEHFGIRVIVKIGNAWSLCPRLTLFSSDGRNCASNYDLIGCGHCTATFRSAGAQSVVATAKAAMRKVGLISYAQAVFHKVRSNAADQSLGNPDSFFLGRRKGYLEDLSTASIIHFSSAMSRDIYLSHGLDGKNSRVLHPSVDISVALSHVPAVSASFRRFGYIGGLSKLKGVDLLIKAFKDLTCSGKPIELMIWGEGDRSLVRSLPENIRYMGSYNRSMLPSIMEQIDCGVIASACPDVHPIVTLEYGAAKRPVVISSSCGTASVSTNVYPELVFDSGSSASLRETALQVVKEWEQFYRRSELIPAPKPIAAVVDEYCALYAELSN